MSDKSEQIDRGRQTSGVFVPAGLLIGMGIGWLFGHLAVGLFIGLGVGLLAMALGHLAFSK